MTDELKRLKDLAMAAKATNHFDGLHLDWLRYTQALNPQAVLSLIQTVERYREALEFYAANVYNEYGAGQTPEVIQDGGDIARAALESK